jgi:hypothetical protein
LFSILYEWLNCLFRQIKGIKDGHICNLLQTSQKFSLLTTHFTPPSFSVNIRTSYTKHTEEKEIYHHKFADIRLRGREEKLILWVDYSILEMLSIYLLFYVSSFVGIWVRFIRSWVPSICPQTCITVIIVQESFLFVETYHGFPRKG